MAKQTKKAKKLAELDPTKLYGVDEAIKTAKANATAKFDETIEIALNLGVDPRHADQMVRGVVTLPADTGKDVRVAVFARGGKAEEATAAGADVVGAEDLMETIQGGTIDFDRCIATPDMMGLVGRLGKVLGPKGLMPNPKLGTVTMNVGEAVKAAKGGQVEYRVEKAGIIHSGIGKASFPAEDLRANFDALVDAVVRAKPTGAKGNYLRCASHEKASDPLRDGGRRARAQRDAETLHRLSRRLELSSPSAPGQGAPAVFGLCDSRSEKFTIPSWPVPGSERCPD